MVSKFREMLEVYEAVLGVDWLDGRVDDKGRAKKRRKEPLKKGSPVRPPYDADHPFQKRWREVRSVIEGSGRGPVDLRGNPHITFLEDIATVLQVADTLPNFKESVLPRLKEPMRKPGQYEPFLHEARIATHLARSGLNVEFVRKIEGVPEVDP